MADRSFPTGTRVPMSDNLVALVDDGSGPADFLLSQLPTKDQLAKAAFTGNYADLVGTPPSTTSGPTLLSGSAAPASSVGKDGDTYLRTGSSPMLYGPKTAGNWGTGVSLIGPAGQDGADGTGAGDALTPQTVPVGTIVATDSNGDFIGIANVRTIPLGLDGSAPANGQIFKGPPMPWPFRVLGIYGRVEGSNTPTVTASLKIGSVDVGGLATKLYGATTSARQNATTNNTGAKGAELQLVVTAAPGGTVTRAAFYVEVQQMAEA